MPKSQFRHLGVMILALSLVLGLFSGCHDPVKTAFPADNGNPMVGRVLAVFDQEGDPYDLILYANGNAMATTVKTKAGGQHGVLGRWEASPETVFINYEDGSKEAFVYYDGTIRRQEYYPLRRVTTPANRYEYGWMVKGPKAGFVGIWYCDNALDVEKNPKAKPRQYILHLASDGKASRTDLPGVVGKWIVTNDNTAMIKWPDGLTDMITATGEGYEMRTWPVGQKPESNAGIKTVAVRRGAF
jgi:hypothetical protein